MSVKVVTVGASGYATTYVHPLLDDMHKGIYTYSGVVARDIEKTPFCDRIREENITVCKSLKEYFEKGNKADLVVIATPTHIHKQDTLIAIENGANVLCEKPVAPTYADALEMIEASEKSGKFVGICYQWSYSKASRDFKKDILSGKFGKAIELKSFTSWPRPWSYYAGGWKGKIKSEDGTLILDSVAANATAHYLHNMYFVLGDKMNTCDFPKEVRCELLRANDIENFDTCLLDITTRNGVKVKFVASHATEKNDDPKFEFKFEKATVRFNMTEKNNHIIAELEDGTTIDYGNPNDNINIRIFDSIDAVKTGNELVCTVKTASAHTLTITELYKNGEIVNFPSELIYKNQEEQITSVNGLYDLLYKAYEKGCLLSDLGIEWAKAKTFTID